ncbi:MAG: mechanosensitive ion channel family protein [Archangium sp.]|nr:mechanosensitive ion channel family protein [Archangium sp.]
MKPTLLLLALVLAPLTASAAESPPDGGTRLFDLPAQRTDSMMTQAGHSLRSSLPNEWLTPSVFGLERWQWGAVPVFGVLIVFLTLILVRGSRMLTLRLNRTRPAVQTVLDRLDAPLRLFWGSLLARIALPLLTFSPGTQDVWERLFRISFGLAFFWGSLRAVAAWSDHFVASTYASQHPGSRSLVSLFTRVTRFALVAFAILATLSEVGYSVTSVLAGLGIGGIALALGAQKTLENVFGAFALAVDQPIRVGDLVRVGELLGTVESIGLRSTRIRSVERTVVSIPNGKLADLSLETFAARDRIRFVQKLALSPETTTDQLQKVIDGCRKIFAGNERLWPDSSAVNLTGLAPGALELELSAWFATTDWDEFRAIREKVLLQVLEVLEGAKAKLSAPSIVTAQK